MTFDITKKWRWLVALGAVFVPALVTAATSSVKVPFKFSPGGQIKAQEMNDNISSLKKAIDGKGAVAPSTIGTLTIANVPQTIAIRRFSQKLTNAGTIGGGGGAARPDVGDLEVSFALGDTSPQLNLAVNAGNHFQTANLAMGPFLIRLEDVILSSMTVDDSAGTVPLQELGIGFARIEWTWQPPGQAARTVTWDRATSVGSGGGTGDGSADYAFFGPGIASNPLLAIPITGYVTDQRCPTPTQPGGGTGACRVAHSPFVMTKTAIGVDVLDDLAGVTRGAHLQSADIQWQILGDDGVMVVQHRTRLEDYLVSSVEITTGTNGNLVQSVGISYSRIQWTVGNRQSGWNVVTGAPF